MCAEVTEAAKMAVATVSFMTNESFLIIYAQDSDTVGGNNCSTKL